MRHLFVTEPKNVGAVSRFAALALVLFPVSIISIPYIHGLINLAILVLGSYFIFSGMGRPRGWSIEEKYFYFALFFLLVTVMAPTLISGVDEQAIKKAGKYFYLLLAIPSYLFFRKVGINLVAFWYGLAGAAMVSAVVAILGILNILETRYAGRASGVTHPIIFGDLSLLMGAMSVAGLEWFRTRGRFQVLIPGVAVAMGLLASFLSQSRGGWVSIPVIAVIILWYFRHSVPKWKMATGVVLLMLGCLLVYNVPGTGVKQKINDTVQNIHMYMTTDISHPSHGSSIGSRFEMWQASWQIFVDNPLLGVGWGNYQQHAQQLVDKGLRHESSALHNHPHNQFLTALVSGGVLAFIATLSLFAIPAIIAARGLGLAEVGEAKSVMLAGFIMVVCFAIFNLSESFLERSRMIGFFVFYLAVMMTAVACRKAK